MSNTFKISTGDLQRPDKQFEITIKGDDEKTNLDTIVKAAKTLIESIDLKHTCDENYEIYEQSMMQILLSIADSIIAEGWEVEDDSEKARLEIISHFIENLRY
jgi:hypothetical protein